MNLLYPTILMMKMLCDFSVLILLNYKFKVKRNLNKIITMLTVTKIISESLLFIALEEV